MHQVSHSIFSCWADEWPWLKDLEALGEEQTTTIHTFWATAVCICTIIGVGERERDWVLPGEHHNHSIQVNRTVCNSFQHKLLICKKVSMQELEVYQKRKSRRHEHKWENTCWLCKVKDYNHTRISEMSDSIQKGIFFFLLPYLPKTREESVMHITTKLQGLALYKHGINYIQQIKYLLFDAERQTNITSNKIYRKWTLISEVFLFSSTYGAPWSFQSSY